MKSGALKMMGDKVIKLEKEIKDLKQDNKDIKEKLQDETNNFIQMVTPGSTTSRRTPTTSRRRLRTSRTSLRSSRTTTSSST